MVWAEATVFAPFYGKTISQAAACAQFIPFDPILAGYLDLKNVTFSGNLLNQLSFRAPGKSC